MDALLHVSSGLTQCHGSTAQKSSMEFLHSWRNHSQTIIKVILTQCHTVLCLPYKDKCHAFSLHNDDPPDPPIFIVEGEGVIHWRVLLITCLLVVHFSHLSLKMYFECYWKAQLRFQSDSMGEILCCVSRWCTADVLPSNVLQRRWKSFHVALIIYL